MNNELTNKPELLAPCGGMESVYAAIRSGADAIYLGGKSFSARRSAANFTYEELKDAVRECHRNGVLVYQAINTLAFDDELESLADEIKSACELGIDGIITQDLAALSIVKNACPDMPIHASTQMSVHTPEGVNIVKDMGYSRCVVARELSGDKIAELCKLGIEIEAFVHGALCMCVSGQCYLSAMIGSRSANRGGCAGACRLPFSADATATDKYALSLKDVCYASHVDEMSRMGVASLKIEGRMKRPEYVAAATDTYRRALDGEEYDTDRLRAVFSRSGFTDGYIENKLGGDMFGVRSKEDVTAAKDVLPELKELYRSERKRYSVDFIFTAELGKPMTLKAFDGTESVTIYGEEPQVARNRATEADKISEQLSKLGGTVYSLGNISVNIGDGLALPISAINALRRDAISELDNRRIDRLATIKSFDKSKLTLCFPLAKIRKIPSLWVQANKLSSLSKCDLSDIEYIILPISEAENAVGEGLADKTVITLPRYIHDEAALAEQLKKVKALGIDTVMCQNISHIRLAKSMGFTLFGGYGLNITNSLSISEYQDLGLSAATLSFETKVSKLNKIRSDIPVGFIAYGRLPLMLLVNCPIRAQVGCKNCKKTLVDRTGAKFKMDCHKSEGYYELLNSKVLHLEDKLDDFHADFALLYFTDETPDKVAEIVDGYRNGTKNSHEATNGLYYRGVE